MLKAHAWFNAFLLCILLLSAALPAASQGTVRATVHGTISDSVGAAIPGANVTLTNTATGVMQTAKTTEAGIYNFPYVDPGEYKVSVSKSGFETAVVDRIRVETEATVPVNVSLAVGKVTNQVQVTANAQLLDPTQIGISGVVSTVQLGQLPNNGQQYAQLIRLQPGVVAGYLTTGSNSGSSFGGSGYIEGRRIGDNVVYIDGGMFYDPWSPSTTVSGLLAGPGVSEGTIAEFRVVGNNPNPDEGFTAGGRIDLTTKSGTNLLHGSAYEFLRNQVFDARNFFTANKLPLKRNLFGGTLGGPIQKDKSFFFGSYEGMRQQTLDPQAPVVPTPLLLAQVPGGAANSYLRQLLEDQFPLPLPGTYGPSALVAVYNTSSNAAINYDIFDTRVDYRVNSKNSFTARYIFNQAVGSPGAVTSTGIPSTNGGANDRWQQSVLSWVSTLSPNLVSETRFTYHREYNAFPAVDTPSSLVTCCGIAQSPTSPYGLPYITFNGTGLTAIGPLARKPQNRADNIFQYDESMTGTRSRHSYTFGGTVMLQQVNDYYPQGLRPQVSFDGFGAPFDTSVDGITTGNVFSETQTFALSPLGYQRGLRRRQFSLFGQDVWQVRPTLTLTLGARYELVGRPFAVQNGLNNLYAANSSGDPIPGVNIANIADVALAYVGGCTGCLDLTKMEKFNLLPRLGVSWMFIPSTIMRAGFGIEKGEMIFNLLSFNRANPGFTRGVNIASKPFTLNLSGSPAISPPVFAYDPGMGRPYTEDWNFTVEHEFNPNTSLQFSYVGNRGVDLLRPFAPNFGSGFVGTRANPNYGQITLWEANSSSWYNALQAQFLRRFSHSLSFQLSYTYSKSLDDSSGEITAYGDLNYPTDPADPNLDKGRSDFDLTHVFVANFVYQLPFGAGSRFLNRSNRIVNGFFGQWQISGIVSANSGQPLTFLSGIDNNGDGIANQRARLLVPMHKLSILFDRNGLPKTQFFNPAAIGTELSATTGIGIIGRNTTDGPAFSNVDFDLSKQFILVKRHDSPVALKFRWQVYDIFNHTNFAQPDSTVSSPLFGRITATNTNPREMEFTAMINF